MNANRYVRKLRGSAPRPPVGSPAIGSTTLLRSLRNPGRFAAATTSRTGLGRVFLLSAVTVSTGCAAAVGAALAAGEIRQGIAGVQELVANSRPLRSTEVEIWRDLSSPLAGTYRGFQALEEDTVRYYIRTVERPAAAIVDLAGSVTGYVLPGIAAVTLDTLEARVRTWTARRNDQPGGRAIFFVEGTQPPAPSARSLYPAAFLGRVAPGESESVDRQDAELRGLEVDMDAPDFDDRSAQGIPHELFSAVAEGIFTLRPDGEAVYHQELELEDGRTLTLHFERISATTLPGVR